MYAKLTRLRLTLAAALVLGGRFLHHFRQHHAVSPALFAALAVGVLMATAGTAAAQTADVSAQVKGHQQRPVGCPDSANLCGDTVIDGFGSAQYRFFLTSFELTSESCGHFTGTTTFTLQNGSRLTLSEFGEACGTGHSFFKGGEMSYGNPRYRSGSWVVESATGQFAGMTGSGTSTAHFAGAHLSATYTGILES